MGQRHLQCTEQMEENSRWLPENRNWALPAIRRIMSHFLGRSLYSCTVRNPALILGPEQVALPVCMSVQNLIFSMLFPYTSSRISYFSGIGLGTRGQHQNRAFLSLLLCAHVHPVHTCGGWRRPSQVLLYHSGCPLETRSLSP